MTPTTESGPTRLIPEPTIKPEWQPPRALAYGAFLSAVLAWMAMAVLLAFYPEEVESVWAWIRDLPLVLQLVAWVLFLPVVLGLWALQRDWEPWIRGGFVAVCATWHLLGFFPDYLSPRR